jgi:hypothetical protein
MVPGTMLTLSMCCNSMFNAPMLLIYIFLCVTVPHILSETGADVNEDIADVSHFIYFFSFDMKQSRSTLRQMIFK